MLAAGRRPSSTLLKSALTGSRSPAASVSGATNFALRTSIAPQLGTRLTLEDLDNIFAGEESRTFTPVFPCWSKVVERHVYDIKVDFGWSDDSLKLGYQNNRECMDHANYDRLRLEKVRHRQARRLACKAQKDSMTATLCTVRFR